MYTPYDAVVVGARVAGASTAMLLARAGLRVALLDRGSYGSDTLSTHGLMRAGVLQLSRWGVLPEVVASGTPPIEKTLFHYSDGDMVQVSIRPTPGVDALYAPRRQLLDRILVDRVLVIVSAQEVNPVQVQLQVQVVVGAMAGLPLPDKVITRPLPHPLPARVLRSNLNLNLHHSSTASSSSQNSSKTVRGSGSS